MTSTEKRGTIDGSLSSSKRASKLRNRGNSDAFSRHGDPGRMTLLPLIQIFNDFGKSTNLTKDEQEELKRAMRLRPEEPDKEPTPYRITLPALEAWFTQAKIFANPLCKITPSDLRLIFAKFGKPALTYRDFENFINELGEFHKIHTEEIVLPLRTRDSPELQGKLSQFAVPEGTMDRLVDALHFDVKDLTEQFVDLSREPYQEPLCFGGIRGQARRAKSAKEEESILTEMAKSIMKKGQETSKLDKLQQNFIYYAKQGSYYSDGRSMGLLGLIKWMKQAGIIDGDNITAVDIGFLFKRLYTLNWKIYPDDLQQVLHELSLWKNIPETNLLTQLRNADEPASSSASIITMQIPESKLELLTKVLTSYAEDMDENREKFEPSSADTPYGHTPNSRNRHFQNDIDESKMKVRSFVLEEIKGGKSGDTVAMMARHHAAKTTVDLEEKEDAFSEERRGGKDSQLKRWNDAYPIGGIDGGHRARIEADLEKIMFGQDRYDDSSSEDDERVKRKINAKYAIVAAPVMAHPAIPLEEQFEKFKTYGEHKADDGVTLPNIELWFELAGMLGSTNSLFNRKELEDKFKAFTYSDQKHYLDFSAFMNYVDALGEAHKKHTNSKEMRDRLTRCGPPRVSNTSASKISIPSVDQLSNRENSLTPSSDRHKKDDDDELDIDPAFRSRFQEFARFGEATVENATVSSSHSSGISMLNADKWFRQAKLTEKGLNPGDVDVLYKQHFPTKQRIGIRDFMKLLDALAHTSKQQGVTVEALTSKLEQAGSPTISEIPHNIKKEHQSISVTASKRHNGS